MTAAQVKILTKAQQVYGNKNQILVAIEELCELCCVLAKYSRYEEHDTAVDRLYSRVIDEVADVEVVLRHIYDIFKISQSDISLAIDRKILRLESWLKNSKDIQYTVDNR